MSFVLAAILGCLAAGQEATGYASISQAIHAMANTREDLIYRPDLSGRKRYAELYALYRSIAMGDGAVAELVREAVQADGAGICGVCAEAWGAGFGGGEL